MSQRTPQPFWFGMSLLIALGLFVVGCLWVLGVFRPIVETVL